MTVTTSIKAPHLMFALGGDDYCVAAEQVRELVAAAPLTPLPGAPAWVRGVFNLRGAVVPLVDLGVKLGLGSTAAARPSWVVAELTVERRRHVLAFETEEVRTIVEIGDAELLATPPTGIRVRGDCVRGLVRSSEGFAVVLDLERVLTSGAAPAGEAGAS